MPRNHVSASQYIGSSVSGGGPGQALSGSRVDDKLIDDHLAVQAIIRSYQVREERWQLDEGASYIVLERCCLFRQTAFCLWLPQTSISAHKKPQNTSKLPSPAHFPLNFLLTASSGSPLTSFCIQFNSSPYFCINFQLVFKKSRKLIWIWNFWFVGVAGLSFVGSSVTQLRVKIKKKIFALTKN